MKNQNPFTLTFGKQPVEYISRHENTNTVMHAFSGDNPMCQTYLIEGVRGSGKTVLMTTISKELESSGDWVVADILPNGDLLDALANRLADIVRANKLHLPSGVSVSLAGAKVEWSDKQAPQDSIGIVEELLRVLQKKKKKVLITIDEVEPGKNMRKFAGEFQILVRKDFPVFLIMTGLYENINSVQNDKTLTFLLRTPKISLEPLSEYQISNQYESALGVSIETANDLAAMTKGYAFAFQALGLLYFEKEESETLEDILPTLDSMLDDYVYKKIWESLSAKDREIIKAVPENGIKTKDICDVLGMDASVFSKYRDRLMKKGLLRSPQYGYVEIALPRFSYIAQRYRIH